MEFVELLYALHEAGSFGKAIETYTRQITSELLDTKIAVANNGGVCILHLPEVQKRQVRLYPKVAKCTDETCGLVVFRTVSEKQLSDSQIMELLCKGKRGFDERFCKCF